MNQITVKNISENITHIISLLDENAAESSPVIARETSQNNSVTVFPQKSPNVKLGMHSKNISRCQDSDKKTEELDDNDFAQRKVENSSDESSNPPSPPSKKQTVQKNLPPLKIKIPRQKNKAKVKSGEEKPACQAKGKKRKKNGLENEEEGENKGFHIDGDMAKFLKHLDQHTRDLFQSTKNIRQKFAYY